MAELIHRTLVSEAHLGDKEKILRWEEEGIDQKLSVVVCFLQCVCQFYLLNLFLTNKTSKHLSPAKLLAHSPQPKDKIVAMSLYYSPVYFQKRVERTQQRRTQDRFVFFL